MRTSKVWRHYSRMVLDEVEEPSQLLLFPLWEMNLLETHSSWNSSSGTFQTKQKLKLLFWISGNVEFLAMASGHWECAPKKKKQYKYVCVCIYAKTLIHRSCNYQYTQLQKEATGKCLWGLLTKKGLEVTAEVQCSHTFTISGPESSRICT